ncbi:uncharacterized protein LOC144583066 [Pogona vitticeps]
MAITGHPKFWLCSWKHLIHCGKSFHGFLTIMQALLKLLIFLVLLTKEGKVEQFLEKGCERSPFCPYDQIQLYLGKGRYYKSGLLCCHDRTCQKNSLQVVSRVEAGLAKPQSLPIGSFLPVPTTETIPNGKQCPACFSWSKTCEPELIECTGSNIYCFNMTSIIDESDQIMMGCASTSACNFFRSRTASLLIEGVKSAVCESTDSRGMRSTSFSLLAFSGILLMNKTDLLMGNFQKATCSPQVSRGTQSFSFLPQMLTGLLMMKIFS